jgi:hypothetical protein
VLVSKERIRERAKEGVDQQGTYQTAGLRGCRSARDVSERGWTRTVTAYDWQLLKCAAVPQLLKYVVQEALVRTVWLQSSICGMREQIEHNGDRLRQVLSAGICHNPLARLFIFVNQTGYSKGSIRKNVEDDGDELRLAGAKLRARATTLELRLFNFLGPHQDEKHSCAKEPTSGKDLWVGVCIQTCLVTACRPSWDTGAARFIFPALATRSLV